jgi:hypothetical protein
MLVACSQLFLRSRAATLIAVPNHAFHSDSLALRASCAGECGRQFSLPKANPAIHA